jgi:hypothetical protein
MESTIREIYQKPFITRAELNLILTHFGFSVYKCRQVYHAICEEYREELRRDGKINPGRKSLPGDLVRSYIASYYITEKSVERTEANGIQR